MALLAAALTTATAAARPAPASATACTIGTPDGTWSGDVQSSARTARAWRLYQAYFLRQPDGPGLDYWLSQYRAGMSLQGLSYNFARSAEFQQRYGALDNSGFVNLVYNNVLCRAPDGDGWSYWVTKLNLGEIDRGEMMVLFSEGAEFGNTTGTRWSSYASPDQANFYTDGYDVQPLPGGLMVRVNYGLVDVRTSHERCSVASINGNWFSPSEAANPTPTGFAVIDGQHVAGSVERDDRGVIGERYRPGGPVAEEVWNWQGAHNLNSNLGSKGGRVLESWGSWQPWYIPRLDNASEWRWAAAGIPLIVNGQVWDGFASVPTNDYTHYTFRHSFVAFDKHWNTLVFGTTTGMTSAGLIAWAQAQGYEDLVKFDGGGSAELNINGQRRVAGTTRDVPVWIGIGC